MDGVACLVWVGVGPVRCPTPETHILVKCVPRQWPRWIIKFGRGTHFLRLLRVIGSIWTPLTFQEPTFQAIFAVLFGTYDNPWNSVPRTTLDTLLRPRSPDHDGRKGGECSWTSASEVLEWVQSTFQFKELLFQTRRDRWMLNSFKSRRRRKQARQAIRRIAKQMLLRIHPDHFDRAHPACPRCATATEFTTACRMLECYTVQRESTLEQVDVCFLYQAGTKSYYRHVQISRPSNIYRPHPQEFSCGAYTVGSTSCPCKRDAQDSRLLVPKRAHARPLTRRSS
ncbi:hypothetical protein T484DRAFT_3111305 [Baffinella frigidus]|nr:hypothetical protein T484DRAFT_3111305 [Cryptophyta sp. CCMP2293]